MERDISTATLTVAVKPWYPPYRTVPIRSPQQLLSQRRLDADDLTGGLNNIQSVHARRSLVHLVSTFGSPAPFPATRMNLKEDIRLGVAVSM